MATTIRRSAFTVWGDPDDLTVSGYDVGEHFRVWKSPARGESWRIVHRASGLYVGHGCRTRRAAVDIVNALDTVPTIDWSCTDPMGLAQRVEADVVKSAWDIARCLDRAELCKLVLPSPLVAAALAAHLNVEIEIKEN